MVSILFVPPTAVLASALERVPIAHYCTPYNPVLRLFVPIFFLNVLVKPLLLGVECNGESNGKECIRETKIMQGGFRYVEA